MSFWIFGIRFVRSHQPYRLLHLMYVVEIGQEAESTVESRDNEFRHQHLLLFLYTIYYDFSLGKNFVEIFIGPRDERNVLQLALAQIECETDASSETLDLISIEIGKRRLFGAQGKDSALIEAVEQILKSNNIVDRVHLLRSIKAEYFENAELVKVLHAANYIVASRQLTWFEHLVVSFLMEIKVPNIHFSKTPDLKPFLSFQHCCIIREQFVAPEPISRSLLAYLAVAVNIKDTLDLAVIINKPFRGFSPSFFSILRRISKNASMLPGQLVLSYPACVTASAATSTLRTADVKLLEPFASSLEHLANTIRACQDALSGFLDDDASLASSSQFGSMSTEAAAEAVRACFTVVLRALARPPRLHEDTHASWSMKEVKEAKSTLSQRLDDLISSPLVRRCESLISSTPNRPIHAGGSIQGRAAYRLARLFLVYEAASQVAPPRNPGALTTTLHCTPIGHRTFNAFFESPAPQNRTPQPSKSLSTTLNESNGTKPKAVHEQVPKRRLHARYQSNLEWATEGLDSPSPVRQTFRLFDEGSNARMEFLSTEDSRSEFRTPKKKPNLSCEQGDKENAFVTSSSAKEAKVAKRKTVKPNKSRSKQKPQLKNQPSILGFLNPKTR